MVIRAPNFKFNDDLNSDYHIVCPLLSFWLQKKKVWEGYDIKLFSRRVNGFQGLCFTQILALPKITWQRD
jgi:hypothetical protein